MAWWFYQKEKPYFGYILKKWANVVTCDWTMNTCYILINSILVAQSVHVKNFEFVDYILYIKFVATMTLI